VAVYASKTESDYHDNWTYVNGAFDLWFAQSWLLGSFAGDTYRRELESSGLSTDVVTTKVADWLERGNKNIVTDWNRQFPLRKFSEFRHLAPYYESWIDHPDYDQYWSPVDLENQYSRIEVPVLSSGGWYDFFAVGTVRNFQGLQARGATTVARNGARLLMMPTCHARTCGPVLHKFNEDVDLTNRWWDYWLKGIENGVAEDPAVEVFVMQPPDNGVQGDGFWLAANKFPLPGTTSKKIHLGSGGNANTREGDGVLDSRRPSHGPADRFVYDPHNPVPTVGGNLCCNALLPTGAFDQSDVELRDDVLVYTSKPLAEDIAVVGFVKLNFWAASSAPDTDFTAKLVDVHHDGFAQNVLDRVVRARYRLGSKKPPALIEPGKVYSYQLNLGPTAIVFGKGHRIRLEISSSNFPHIDRNNNTGGIIADDTEMRTAEQTIFHSSEYDAYLDLPVVSRALLQKYAMTGTSEENN